jgi:phospholipase/lecithinase/hemolysin
VKNLFQLAFGILLFGVIVLPTQAAFTSLYVFGDALSATADPKAPGGSYFYGQRWSNGRVWVEVLAQRQGLTINNTNNNSYWDHNSSALLTELNNFSVPANVANDLFIVWVCNADTYDATLTALNDPNTNTNHLLNQFISANIQSQPNHLQIITNLYADGVRTLILPNAVDISTIPAFNAGTLAGVEHAGCIDYNARFSNTINQASALCPGLTIYTPDYFTLLNNVLTNAAYYGLTNALSSKGFSIDAYDDPSIVNLTLNGQGTNYIFWDPQDPTAMLHEVMADVAQQLISPVQFSGLKQINGSNQLNVVNMPVGLNGFLDGSTNPVPGSWTLVTNFNSLTNPQSLFVITPPLPAGFGSGGGTNGGGGGSINPNPGTNTVSGTNTFFNTAGQFYRLRFPYAWNWP